MGLINLTDLQNGRSLDLLPIGQPIPIMNYMFTSSVEEILTKSKFIELTKNLDDTIGEFNYGKLTGQAETTVGASNSEKYYTATVSLVGSPLETKQIILMNSSEVQLSDTTWVNIPTVLSSYAGGDAYRFGRFQDSNFTIEGFANISGVAPIDAYMVSGTVGGASSTRLTRISNGGNGTPRVGSSTEQSSVVCKMYMRII